MKNVIAFAGSNSTKSINQQLINWVARQETSFNIEVVNLNSFQSEIFSEDSEREKGHPESMLSLADKFQKADGFIISSPEHNGSMPAFLKNTIDWQSRINRSVFNEKPTVLLSASPGGRGGAGVIEQMNSMFPHLGAKIVGTFGVGGFYDKFSNGDLVNSSDSSAILEVLNNLNS